MAGGAIELEDGAPVRVTASGETTHGSSAPATPSPWCFSLRATAGRRGRSREHGQLSLIRRGVPLVLSMQTRVTVICVRLAREFYAELANRETPLASDA